MAAADNGKVEGYVRRRLEKMLYTSFAGSLSGEGCRDKDGNFVPVPQCLPHPFRKKLTGGLANLAQASAPLAPDPGSYEQIWGVLWSTCVSMAGEDACSRLLGHTPFVCPVSYYRSS
jgi:hypothetical protein